MLDALARRSLDLPLAEGRRRCAEELEDSLRRLGVDAIDLYQIHWPNPEEEIEEGWEALARFKRAGQGALDWRVQLQRRADEARAEDRAHHQPAAALFHAAPRHRDRRFCPSAQANGIGVINYSPMVSGLLTGQDDGGARCGVAGRRLAPASVEFNEPRLSRNLRLVELLREIGNGHGVSPAWWRLPGRCTIRRLPAAIVGGRSAEQVEGMAAALDFRLSEEEYARINDFLDANAA